MKTKIIIAAMIASAAMAARAEEADLTRFGDVIHHGMPLVVLGVVAKEGGASALKDAALANLANRRTVLELKKHIHKERPNGTDNRSFPSGHSASTFGAAASVHARYGLEAAIVPYALAAITGASRVAGKHHYIEDVLAGAAIGMAWSFAVVSPRLQIDVQPEREKVGVSYTFEWK